MSIIENAIRESREREAEATKGPWRIGTAILSKRAEPELLYVTTDQASLNKPDRQLSRGWPICRGPRKTDAEGPEWEANAKFIAAAKTWEPRFREAFAVLEADLRRRMKEIHVGYCEALEQAERILEGK